MKLGHRAVPFDSQDAMQSTTNRQFADKTVLALQ
jgi:hypothetical protein